MSEERAGKVRVQVWLERSTQRMLRYLAIEDGRKSAQVLAGELLTTAITDEARRTGLAALLARYKVSPPNDTADDVEAGSRASLAAMQRIVDGGIAANVAHREAKS